MDKIGKTTAKAEEAPKGDLVPIPGPKSLPILGNLLDIDLNSPLASCIDLAKKYGAIYQLVFAGSREIQICSRELADEVCDETRFHKLVTSGVYTLRQVAEDGLFTAQYGNHSWGVAHRILKPVFGPLKIRDMFDEMNDIAEQLCLKWARLGSATAIDVAADFTRLTLDTIALCLMDYRFNSFYLNDSMHPFVESMLAILGEADLQAMLPDWAGFFRPQAMAKFRGHIEVLTSMCHRMVEQRRKHPIPECNDFLNAMLNGRDPQTGEGMDDKSIVHNLITFLVAGHETTSGMLSFVLFYLVENPIELHKAREEVDRVLGNEPLSVAHLQKLPFLDSVFRETLRLMPTAPGFYLAPFQDEVIGGKYLVRPNDALCVLLDPLHRDPEIWGDDADKFRPERMSQKNFDSLPPNAWKPFGNGMRGCIGKAFAWQEAQLITAMILRTFDISKADPNYALKVKHLLTIKPDGFRIHARLRNGRRATEFSRSLRTARPGEPHQSPNQPTFLPSGDSETPRRRPMTILYGSDTGTCEVLAHRLGVEASSRGFAPKVAPMNSGASNLPNDQPVLIAAATYNGQPSANAIDFVSWAEKLQPGDLQGVEYAIFGCGHSDWKTTLFKVPKTLDALFEKAGATRLADLGTADTARADVFVELEAWTKHQLWPAVSSDDDFQSAPKIKLEVTISDSPRVAARKGFVQAYVTDNKVLSNPGVPQKRHLEIRLPEGMTYDAGGHIQILPRNDNQTVQHALSCFQLSSDTVVTITRSSGQTSSTSLPINTPITASDLFTCHVDLRHAASPGDMEILIEAAIDEATKAKLRDLTSRDDRLMMSVLAILQSFPQDVLPLSLTSFLLMLRPMRQRTYSFSSSPEWKAGHASLTVAVVDQTLTPDRGLASNYLASLEPGDVLYVSPNQQQSTQSSPFRLPESMAETPVIMIAAGTGLAPFRGFIQERTLRLKKARSKQLAPAVLFFGCRGPQLDDQLKVCREEVVSLWNSGANVYVCGGKKMANGVFDLLGPLLSGADRSAGRTSESSITAWLDTLPKGRYVVEVFT